MVAMMWDHENTRTVKIENMFRIAKPEEISKPQRFKHLYHDSRWVERTHTSAVALVALGGDNMEDRLHAMRERNKQQPRHPQKGAEEKLSQPKHEKGKGQENTLTEEDFP